MYKLDSFGLEFWSIQDVCVKHSGRKPTSIEQALWEMSEEDWEKMVRSIFSDYHPGEISVGDVMMLIRETNTCSNLDFPVEVWIDEDGDFTIKVYDK